MILNTRSLGEIEIEKENIIVFQNGIPGFENITEFVIVENPDKDVPFCWLQAINDSNVAFVIINPFVFKPGYDFEIPSAVVEKLEIRAPEEVLVYSIVVIPEDVNQMTANLVAPIIINTKNNKGKQVVLDDNRYNTKHYILEEMKMG